jgi:low temperature requirement protein LtrA
MPLHAPTGQPVTFVELFFDLVFVFAVTQVTAFTVHHLDGSGVAHALLLFWLIWWAWTQFTWSLSPADTEAPAVRVATLAAAAIAFVMAASVPEAFDEGGGLWFAVPYVAIRAVGMAIQVAVDREDADHSVSRTWLTISAVGLLLVLVGGAVDPSLRPWVWLAVVAADVLAAVGASDAVWDLDARHFSERHGLFVIIALGESLIVAGTVFAGEERTADLVVAAGLAVTVVCLLWWTYFGWLKEQLEHHFSAVAPEQLGVAARDAFSLQHFPLICGVIGVAVAIEEIALHPGEPQPGEVIAALVVGIGLFVGASAGSYRRLSGVLLVPRLVTLAVTLALTVAVAGADPAVPLAVVAAGLLAICVLERGGPERSEPDVSTPLG